jgi:hypothetical protein
VVVDWSGSSGPSPSASVWNSLTWLLTQIAHLDQLFVIWRASRRSDIARFRPWMRRRITRISNESRQTSQSSFGPRGVLLSRFYCRWLWLVCSQPFWTAFPGSFTFSLRHRVGC